jgi:hypothetical protein
MNKLIFIFILNFLSGFCLFPDEIAFSPELLWWIYEIKKVNNNVEIQNFKFSGESIEDIIFDDSLKILLKYPVLMRWNYSGNYFAYNDYHHASIYRGRSGKYVVGNFDDVGFLMIADRNKNAFFCDSFGLHEELDAIYWLTDNILVGVGEFVGDDVHVFIKIYHIDRNNNKVIIKTYFYENAYRITDRPLLKLRWFEQRNDYFEN